MPIKAVVFDAYGTLYDVQSVEALAEQLCPGRGNLITQIWRLKQLEYTWLRSLMEDYQDFWAVTRDALRFALGCAGVEASPALVDELAAKYNDLSPYPEAIQALDALAPLKRAILSNGSPGMLAELVRRSGLESRLEAVLSIEPAGRYKPSMNCYALACDDLGLSPSEILFVSSNGFDVAGAKRFGFPVAWIWRARALPAPAEPVGPAAMYRLLRVRPEELGYPADHVLNSLAELPTLLASLGATR